mmetsp:Transcript_4007/g.9148  ORF Transcript_4007/g.9148 Transcript_4007/m.9148 type:complete len:233 (-) Transcript_4007:1939-2637(-)
MTPMTRLSPSSCLGKTLTNTLIWPRRLISSASAVPIAPFSGTNFLSSLIPSPSSSTKLVQIQFPTLTPHMPQPFRDTVHSTPRPGTTTKSVTLTPSEEAPTSPPHIPLAALTIALARGCSLFVSAHAASQRATSSFRIVDGRTCNSGSDVFVTSTNSFFSARTARPDVIVPVLSKMTVSTPCAASRTAPPLISKPFVAPTPVPTITAVGVARPKAHGQATTITLIADIKATK